MRELEKIAYKHKYPKMNPMEKNFLELVLCPYKGGGKMEKEPLNSFMRERRAHFETEDKLVLPLVMDRAKMSKDVELPEEAFRTRDQLATLKSKKEDEERMKREQEREEFEQYSSLAFSVLKNKRSQQFNKSQEDDISWLGSGRKKAYFVDMPNEDESMNNESRLRLPIHGDDE